MRKTLTGNNPKLDLVKVDARKKIGKIMSIRSQDIEWNRNSDVNQGPLLLQFCKKMMGHNPNLDLVSVDGHTNFGQILSICSRAIKRKRNPDDNQGP